MGLHVGFKLGPASIHEQSIIGVIFRAPYNYIVDIIQLLNRGAVLKVSGFEYG